MFRAVFSVKTLDNSLIFWQEIMNYEILKHVIITSPQTTGHTLALGPYQRRCGCVADFPLSTSWAYRLSTESWLSWAGRWDQALQTVGTWGENCGLGEPCLVRKVGLAESGWSWTVYWSWAATTLYPFCVEGDCCANREMDMLGAWGGRSQGGWAARKDPPLGRVGRQ